MEFSEVIQKRFSCRKFDETRQLAKETLEAILEAGRLAPTAKNFQEQRIYVLQSKEMLEKIDQVTRCRYGAPVVLVVAYDRDHMFTYPGGRCTSGAEDAAIVATHMILAAANEGADSLWINLFDPDVLHQELHLPENEEILMLMALGYGAEGVTPQPFHGQRRALSETVTYL